MSVSDWESKAAEYRVAVRDPLPLFRLGLISSLATAGARVESIEDVERWVLRPDQRVVLLTLVDPDDWRLLGDLCAGHAGLVVIAVLDRPESTSYIRAVDAGASGVVARRATPEQILAGFAAAIGGEMILPTQVVWELAARKAAESQDLRIPSSLEIGWLRDLAAGQTVAALAQSAGYSERMMFRLLRNLYARMGVTQRTAALMLAHERGWLR